MSFSGYAPRSSISSACRSKKSHFFFLTQLVGDSGVEVWSSEFPLGFSFRFLGTASFASPGVPRIWLIDRLVSSFVWSAVVKLLLHTNKEFQGCFCFGGIWRPTKLSLLSFPGFLNFFFSFSTVGTAEKRLKRQVSTLAPGHGVDRVSVLIWVDLKIHVVNSFPSKSRLRVLFLVAFFLLYRVHSLCGISKLDCLRNNWSSGALRILFVDSNLWYGE